MTKKYRSALMLFIIFCLLSFYSYGTAMMDYFLLYPSRFIVGEKEFSEYHKLLEAAIFPISVFPFLAIIILNAILLGLTPAHVSKRLLWMSMICLTLDFLSTVFFQAPWNMQLSEGKNIALMQKITDTNWARVFLESAQAIIVFIMLKQFIFGYAGRESQSWEK